MITKSLENRKRFRNRIAMGRVGIRSLVDFRLSPVFGVASLVMGLLCSTVSAQLPDRLAKMFEDPLERWDPPSGALEFNWAGSLPGEGLDVVVLVPRWRAYEVMELDRRLDMDVAHIYFESADHFWDSRRWHYSNTTGRRPIGVGLHMRRALSLLKDDKTDLYLVAGINSKSGAIPKEIREQILDQVRAGKGLLIAGDMDYRKGWPEELFADPDPELARKVESAFDLEQIPGFRSGEPGRKEGGTDSNVSDQDVGGGYVHAYRYGEGRVVVVQYGLFSPHIAMPRESSKASLVPLTYADEGVEGATDRALAFMARAALIASNRNPEVNFEVALREGDNGQAEIEIKVPSVHEVDAVTVRVQDAYDRTLCLTTASITSGSIRIPLVSAPYGDILYVDVVALNGAGDVLDFASRSLQVPEGPRIAEMELGPIVSGGKNGLTPMLDLAAGGELKAHINWVGLDESRNITAVWVVSDVTGRVLARHESEIPAGQKDAEVELKIPTPVVLSHLIEVSLLQDGMEKAYARKRFTVPAAPFDEDDFWVVLWGTTGAEPISRVKNRILYEEGADALLLAKFTRLGMPGDESKVDREYSMLGRTGLRALPYATRIYGTANKENHRIPSLFDKRQGGWYMNEINRLAMISEIGKSHSPLAINLGDENYLLRYGSHGGDGEVDYSPAAVKSFQEWLADQYGDIAQLNDSWGTDYRSFAEIEPLLIGQALQQDRSFAAWLEHKRFMAESFTGVHDQFATQVWKTLPDTLVGWEGLFGYGHSNNGFDWRLGYDYAGLTENQRVNVTYISNWLSSELTRSFAKRGTLSGKWGNQVANNEAGFSGHPWDVLLAGMNSAWWWHSWGTYYTPFNPNITLNDMGTWFLSAVREIKAGPGKLLLGAERDDAAIGILYAPRDMYVSTLVGELTNDSDAGGSKNFWEEQAALLRAIKDLGYQYRYVSLKDLESGALSYPQCRILFLSYPVSVSKEQIEALKRFVSSGGTLVVNGRAGLLSETGLIQEEALLDKPLLGVKSTPGMKGLTMPSRKAVLDLKSETKKNSLLDSIEADSMEVSLLDTELTVTDGTALAQAEGVPVLILKELGKGVTLLTNFSWRQSQPVAEELLGVRLGVRIDEAARLGLLDTIIRNAEMEPPAEIITENFERPKAVEQVLFLDGKNRYLALQQDLQLLNLPPQKLKISLEADGIVYDVRQGRLISGDVVDAAEGSHVPYEYHEWEAEIERGNPLLYAILPYKVTGLQGTVRGEASRGNDVLINVKVDARGGVPQRHVVRMDVYAPGADRAHREYSQTINCPQGMGQATIPFALNDPSGKWKVVLRDVATGTTETMEIQLD